MMTDKEFERFIRDVDEPFSGWDFSYITESGRVSASLLSWSYGSMAMELIQKTTAMLDMGTGGGEFLSMLQPFPEKVCATEGYLPNVPIARKRLDPLGVEVLQIGEDDLLPFQEKQFDLIINKHESYSPVEVRRVLTDDGIFLTQQVGGEEYVEINEALGAPVNDEFAYWKLSYAKKELEDNGFKVLDAKEEFPIQRFYDIGALVYYLKAIPWQIPDFKSEDYRDELYKVHKLIQSKGYFDVKQHRFLLKARKK
jgi:SAM-dependent methyltransferase